VKNDGVNETLEPRPEERPDEPETRWPLLYGAVLLALSIEVLLFHLLTRSFG
jgi:hypothetical protein